MATIAADEVLGSELSGLLPIAGPHPAKARTNVVGTEYRRGTAGHS
jgi:hypothetical protein